MSCYAANTKFVCCDSSTTFSGNGQSDFHSSTCLIAFKVKLYILYNIGTTVPLSRLYMLHMCFLCLSVSMFLVCSLGL